MAATGTYIKTEINTAAFEAYAVVQRDGGMQSRNDPKFLPLFFALSSAGSNRTFSGETDFF